MADEEHLKIIRQGLDTRQVIARFEAERQALAVMEHPGIARVIDAGATTAGRPYFVMELVDGDPISKYCEDHQFSVEQRLQLFGGGVPQGQGVHDPQAIWVRQGGMNLGPALQTRGETLLSVH